MKYCIYELICPTSKLVKYVGMSRGVRVRYKAHRNGDEKSTKDFFNNSKEAGLLPILKIRVWELEKKEAISLEDKIIYYYKNLGQCELNTYIGHTQLTKKLPIKLIPRQEKMAKTRKIQCEVGIERERLTGYNEKRKIQLIDQNGIIYESLRDCERITGCHRVSIKKVLLGTYKQTNGYVFRREYV
jgi:predicted GIY-YIG superfamily endonuclease